MPEGSNGMRKDSTLAKLAGSNDSPADRKLRSAGESMSHLD